MAVCNACGNDYVNTFEVVLNGKSYNFDSFECAIHHLAPTCHHCGCKIIGHGIEAGANKFCCANCARQKGVFTAKDHA